MPGSRECFLVAFAGVPAEGLRRHRFGTSEAALVIAGVLHETDQVQTFRRHLNGARHLLYMNMLLRDFVGCAFGTASEKVRAGDSDPQ